MAVLSETVVLTGLKIRLVLIDGPVIGYSTSVVEGLRIQLIERKTDGKGAARLVVEGKTFSFSLFSTKIGSSESPNSMPPV